MDWADEIAEQLLDFWNWQAEKGLARDMQGNIAAALRDARKSADRPQIGSREQSAGDLGLSLKIQ